MRTLDELETGWAARTPSPRDIGSVRWLCVRVGEGHHETPQAVEITATHGIRGDRWALRGPGKDPDGYSAVTLMNVAVAELITTDNQRLDASGDNIVVDLDISVDALPAGSHVAIGDAILRISEQPHTGCSTFSGRFGLDALKWVSTREGRAQRLRGVNCGVIRPGTVRIGDRVEVVSRTSTAPEPDEATAAAI